MNPPNWIRWLMVYSGQNKFAALDEPKQEIIPIIEYIEYKAIVHNAIRLCFFKLSAFVRCFKYGSEIANDEMHPNKSRIQLKQFPIVKLLPNTGIIYSVFL